MGADRLPSQRQPCEERQEQADATTLQRRINELEEQLLSKASCSRKLKKQIFAERDSQIYKHLKEKVFPGKKSALLRLICGFSKREAHMVSQSFKYTRNKDGTRTRTMLAPDSAKPLPVPFELADIKIAESEALAAVNLPASEYSAQRANTTFNVTRREKLPRTGLQVQEDSQESRRQEDQVFDHTA